MFKPELILPPLFSAVLLTAWILYLTRRLKRDLQRQSVESNAKADAAHRETMARYEAEFARIEEEKAARAAERAEATAAAAAGFDLVLTLDAGADADEVFGRVVDFIGELDEYAQAGGGAGLTLDPAQSRAEPGTVTLRLVPTDPQYVAKQREVVMAQSRKIAGVSEVELVTAWSRQIAGVSEVEFAAA